MSQAALTDLSSVSVLCVDDDPLIRTVVRFALQNHGCQDVMAASGGPEALDLCSDRSFNLLICDYQMRPMTGLDFLTELARRGQGEGWPVIMLSAETDPATFQEAHELGISSWLSKPVSAQTLVENIGAVLQRRGQITRTRQDPKLLAKAEHHHARLLAALRAAGGYVQGLKFRPRETVILAQSLRRALDDVIEQARVLGYELIIMLATRAMELVGAVVRNPAAATRGNVASARVLGTLVIAMTRVAQNRMEGDGALAGLNLLESIDALIDPVRARFG